MRASVLKRSCNGVETPHGGALILNYDAWKSLYRRTYDVEENQQEGDVLF